MPTKSVAAATTTATIEQKQPTTYSPSILSQHGSRTTDAFSIKYTTLF
jgi:hypothetical protein